MNVWQIVDHAARARPEALAVVDGKRRLVWREVRERAARLAVSLREGGVGPGDRVAVLAWNGLEFLEATFAAAGLGAQLCPLNVRLAPRELRRVLEDVTPRRLVVDAELAERTAEAGYAWEGALAVGGGGAALLGVAGEVRAYEDALAAADPARFEPADVRGPEVAQLYSTSGSTGDPKGVPLTHDNLCVHALCAAVELGLGPKEVWGHCAPMFHLADAWATLAVTWVGGVHAMLRRFEARAALELVARERVTRTNLIPTMLARAVDAARGTELDLGSLVQVLSGGAPIAPALVRRSQEVLGCDYVQTYGMTETSPFLTLGLLTLAMRALPLEERLRQQGKTGRPMLGVELEVFDEDHRPVDREGRDGPAVGEIRVRGATVTPGYRGRPRASDPAFHDGWLRTGDLATVGADGFVSIVDRAKDVILTGGETVYCAEVEKVLAEHPAVLETAVFGLESQEWGEIVAAAVVLARGCEATLDELREHCRARLAGYKVPRSVELVPDLPRTGSGKIDKRALRARRSIRGPEGPPAG